ncbi:MAG: beta-galactosidase trimerization domain-containing protein [Bryobacteraceae bacterium]|nr:beta-galactosidase trimerization domain-containing protein [Bryobacteraceae bacterium]
METKPSQPIPRRDVVKGAALVAGAGLFPAAAAAASDGGHWTAGAYRHLHIDAHFSECDEVYASFDAEAAARMFETAGFQMVCYFGACHGGYSYYPTRIGVVHPGLKRNFTGEMTKALKKRGIRTLVYMKAGFDRRHHRSHPEWLCVHDPSQTTATPSGESGEMCLNSPWVDQVQIPQAKEILSLYDPDGFFFDIAVHQFITANCYCRYCRESFAREAGGEMPDSDNHPAAFAYRKWANRRLLAHIDKLQAELGAEKPDVVIVTNWAWLTRLPLNPPSYVKLINWDPPPPNMSVYALNFSLEARYLSSLGDRAWCLHNTRGNTWGDYALREEAAFREEVAIELAAGGRSLLSDDAYPSGNPDPEVYELYSRVNQRTRELEPYVKDCRPVKDVAILHSADSIGAKTPMVLSPEWKPSPAYHPVTGAHKALVEGHVQVAILNSDVLVKTLEQYKALILPDQRILDEKEIAAIRQFVREGGSLFATHATSSRDVNNHELADFALADVLGIRLAGAGKSERSFLRIPERIAAFGVPRMDVQLTGGYTRVETTTARTLAPLVEGEGPKQAPAVEPAGPGITLNRYGKGRAIYCAAPLFSAYYAHGPAMLRKLALWMLDVVHPATARSIVLDKAPPSVEVFFNERGQDRFVHLVNYAGDKREGGPSQSQERARVHGVRVRARTPARPSSVAGVPAGRAVAFEWREGWVTFEAAPFDIHDAYLITG